jgi:multidrug efflux system outer membrane protein
MKAGPDFKRPDAGIEMRGSYQHAPAKAAIAVPKDRWWEVFNSRELNELVDEVLKNNLDIKAACARILELKAQFVQTRADRFPDLNLEGKAQRQSRGETQKTTTYNLSMVTSFELDLWGRLARSEEAARADLMQAEENRRTVTQTMVAETISLYLKMESLERRIQITTESIENYRRSLTLIETRYRRGLTTILDVTQARRSLAQAEASLPSLHQELGLTQQKMAVLLGRYPETKSPRLQPEDYFKRLAPVPAGLPSDILMSRPDIRAAEAGLMALNAQVGVAKGSRFPRITITGSFGYSSEELSDLFRPESRLWNLAMGIVQPLFDAGKLKAVQKAAQARYQKGVIEYAKTVLTAFSEVEGALLTRREQLKRRDRTVKFLKEARATQEISENRYLRGLVNYLPVLDAQQARFQAEENLVLVDLEILNNRVTLHRALGGGWGGRLKS